LCVRFFNSAVDNPILNFDPTGLIRWRTVGKGVFDLGKATSSLAFGVLEEFTAGAFWATGRYTKSASSAVSGFNDINESSKYLTSSFTNIMRGFQDKESISHENLNGIFDPMINTKFFKRVNMVNELYGYAKLFNDPFNSLKEAKSINTYFKYLDSFTFESIWSISLSANSIRSDINKFKNIFW